MQSTFMQKFRGYVRLEVRGGNIEQLLNLLVQKGLPPWDVTVASRELAAMNLLLPNVFKIRPLLKQTGCRIHVRQRFGFPFFLDKLGRRKFFAAGMLAFVAGIYLLSSIVWSVSVDGNEKLSKDEILKAARQEGIFPMQWKFRLHDPDRLSRGLHTALPGTAWVGVEIHGTQIRIKVVESQNPEEKQLLNPRSLIAARNAVVTEIFAEKGRPLVKPNTYVRKGDVLISGVVGDEQNQQIVVAQGKVKGLVWYTANVEVPLVLKRKVYTGESKNRDYLVIGNRGLQLTGYGKLPFTDYETIPDRTMLQWRSFTFPFGWLKEKLMEVRFDEVPMEPETARQMGLEQAKADLLLDAGEDAKITGEKILHEKTENGKVYMEVHFEVEQSIAIEQPIIQGQGE